MNKGPDDLYNQIKQSEDFIEYSMNLYSADNNLFVNIPLFNNKNHDYYYNFDPKSSEKECIELRNSLFKLDKYKIDSKKIYDE